MTESGPSQSTLSRKSLGPMRCPGQRRSPPFRPAPAQLAAPAGPLQSAFAVEPTTPPKSMTAARVAAGSRRPGSTRLARPRAASRCGRLKATQNPPRDIAVGNDEQPRLQMAAHTDRAMRAAGIGDSAAPLGAGLANAPTCDGVMELFSKGVHRRREADRDRQGSARRSIWRTSRKK